MAKRLRRPSKRVAMFAIVGGAGLLVVAFLLIYFVVFPTSSPKPFTLDTSSAGTAAGATAAATQATSVSELTGHWKLVSGSQAGYRVREKLAFLPAESDAVGRTSQISGAATFSQEDGTVMISAASFDVAVSTLTSDRAQRDEKIHEIGLESSRYPTATFVLSKPLTVSASALAGKVGHVSVTGIFNIHGTSRKETLPVEMSLSGATFQAVGALTFPWSEFAMSAPSIGGFVNVSETATMEFDLHLQRP
jgi:polyisoprenoid-binding protein YceI